MVTVKEIKRENRNGKAVISAIGYEEGKENLPFTFLLDAKTLDLMEASREMDPYLYHAISILQDKIEETGKIPESAVSMWC